MKVKIELDMNQDAREYRVAARLNVNETPLPLVFVNRTAPRDAYVESRWGDQALRTLATQATAEVLRAFYQDHWHALRFAEKVDEQVGG